MGQIPYDVDNCSLEWKWKQALTKCYRILLEEYGPNRINSESKQFAVTVDLLAKLAQRNGGNIHIYTTNYDCSFQVLATNCDKLKFLTHIDDKTGRFTDTWHHGNQTNLLKLPRVYIHRLHGCIAWFNVSDPAVGGSVIREVYGAGSNLEIVDDDFLHQMCIKLISSQLVGTNQAFASAFDEFCSHLRVAQILLIWGYSFRDLEVVRAINHAFSERSSTLPIFYIDPFLSESLARDRIEFTLLTAPVPPSPGFMPKMIDWTTPDGLDNLVPKVMKTLNKYIKGGIET
jgi:hypothetical protein